MISTPPNPARLRRAAATNAGPSSMQVTRRPRAASGRVALPEAQPTSSTRSPSWRPVRRQSSSNSACGILGSRPVIAVGGRVEGRPQRLTLVRHGWILVPRAAVCVPFAHEGGRRSRTRADRTHGRRRARAGRKRRRRDRRRGGDVVGGRARPDQPLRRRLPARAPRPDAQAPPARRVHRDSRAAISTPDRPLVEFDRVEVPFDEQTTQVFQIGAARLRGSRVSSPGLAAVHGRFGSQPWRDLLMPAAAAANAGRRDDQRPAGGAEGDPGGARAHARGAGGVRAGRAVRARGRARAPGRPGGHDRAAGRARRARLLRRRPRDRDGRPPGGHRADG